MFRSGRDPNSRFPRSFRADVLCYRNRISVSYRALMRPMKEPDDWLHLFFPPCHRSCTFIRYPHGRSNEPHARAESPSWSCQERSHLANQSLNRFRPASRAVFPAAVRGTAPAGLQRELKASVATRKEAQ